MGFDKAKIGLAGTAVALAAAISSVHDPLLSALASSPGSGSPWRMDAIGVGVGR